MRFDNLCVLAVTSVLLTAAALVYADETTDATDAGDPPVRDRDVGAHATHARAIDHAATLDGEIPGHFATSRSARFDPDACTGILPVPSHSGRSIGMGAVRSGVVRWRTRGWQGRWRD